MKFKLEIELGNAAMLDPADVAKALRDAAEQLESYSAFHTGLIRDENGNTVGKFEVRP